MIVKLVELGKATRNITVEGEAASLQKVLDTAKVTIREDKKADVKDEVLVNGQQVTDMKTRVANNAVITVVPKIKGGRS